ncbi:MAG: hypothetical protein ACFFCS_22070 [Candidatus Hodarchaeota archaeon]
MEKPCQRVLSLGIPFHAGSPAKKTALVSRLASSAWVSSPH